jgi:hypothetical protein
LKDQNDAAVIVYEGTTVHFDDGDFDTILVSQ